MPYSSKGEAWKQRHSFREVRCIILLYHIWWMVSECSLIIPVFKSHFHFSWCVLNMSKLVREAVSMQQKLSTQKGGFWFGSGRGFLVGNEHLCLLLLRSQGTHGSSWSLSDRWEADWKKQEKSSSLQWLILSWKGTLYSSFSSGADVPIMLVCLGFSVRKIDWGVTSGLPSRIYFIL